MSNTSTLFGRDFGHAVRSCHFRRGHVSALILLLASQEGVGQTADQIWIRPVLNYSRTKLKRLSEALHRVAAAWHRPPPLGKAHTSICTEHTLATRAHC